MPTLARSALRSHAVRCLASALAVAIGGVLWTDVHAAAAGGGVAVINCNDQGPGSLRDAINVASSSDTIDLKALTCSTISLTTGALVLATDSLTIQDSARVHRLPDDGTSAADDLPPPRITIDGGGVDRVFDHTGIGSFELDGVALRHGAVDGNGGCIRSAGSVVLGLTTVSGCLAHDTDYQHGKGGGVYAAAI